MAPPHGPPLQEPVPPYALAPLLLPTLPADDNADSSNPESPAAIQRNAQRSIRCSESDGSYLYIGTSDGFIHSFQIAFPRSSTSIAQFPSYSLRFSRSISNNAKPVERIVLLRPFNSAAVLCEGVVSFFSLPDWSPIRSLPSTRAVSTIVLDDEESEHGSGADAAGMISVCLVRRKNIVLGKIGADPRSGLLWATVKDIPLPGGAIFARRFADVLCIANATEYSLVNLSSGHITQLHLPISQTGESPSAQVRPSIVTVPVQASNKAREGSVSPVVDRSASTSLAPVRCEFLVTSHSGAITLGVFVKPSGEPAPKLLEWPSHPRSVTYDGNYLVSLLRNDTIEIHGLGHDFVEKVQTLQLPPGLDPRFLQSVQDPTSTFHRKAADMAEGEVSASNDLDIVKVSLNQLDDPDAPVMRRASEHASESSSSPPQILICGRNSTSAIQQDSLLSWTYQQLHRSRLRSLRDSLNSFRVGRPSQKEGHDSVRASLESSIAHALLGIELLYRTDFSTASEVLRNANLDPRLLLALYPSLKHESQKDQEAVIPALVLPNLEKLKHKGQDRLQSIDELVTANLTLNYSPPLNLETDKTLDLLKKDLLRRSDAVLRVLLEDWRESSVAAASTAESSSRLWAGSFMDEQMLANVNSCVDSAYLQLIAQQRGVAEPGRASVEEELGSFLGSKHACESSLVEKVLQEKRYLRLLAEHHEHAGKIEEALKIWTALIDGEMTDAFKERIHVPAALSKVAALLSEQTDPNLLSSYGRWLIRRDPEAGIRILTKQTAIFTPDTSKKSTSRTKAQELEAIQAQKATIDELRDIDAEAATKYLEVVALSTAKVQDEQMHRELAAALLHRVGQHLKEDDYREKMETVAHEYAVGSYAESFFAHLALASSGSRKDMDRLKLAMLLQGSTVLEYESLLETITPLETLVYEKAIILGKLGRDGEALSLLAIDLRDANSAEAYCSQDGEVLSPMLANSIAEDHEALRPFAAMLSRTYAQRVKAQAKATTQRELWGVQRKEELLKQLLSVYMANGAQEKFRIATAHLLNTQALHLDNREVLELVPKDWPLQTLETFLTQSLRRQLHRKRELQMLRSIAKCRNLDVAEDLWARQRAMGGILQDDEMEASHGDRGGDGAGDEEEPRYVDWKEGDMAKLGEKKEKQQQPVMANDAVFAKEARIDSVQADYEIHQSNIVHAQVDDVDDLT
ncbi:related to TGF beta receptor associated protein-1 [Ustilago trichophora]|uniref:Related to TGF beta receptor associated protein-1 n=1 Tax=Ustilago trichophora TaxID=86804 RepID=A0A5C3DXH7_9BASI|nr:related to TGF beta receptor associated protein-1 [Ustilago trichophora]